MSNGKLAGVRCIQLAEDNRCQLFGKTERLAVCCLLQSSEEMYDSLFQDAFIAGESGVPFPFVKKCGAPHPDGNVYGVSLTDKTTTM
jgi:hypothetical protein